MTNERIIKFKEVYLKDLADVSTGHAFKSKNFKDKGVFVLRTLNIEKNGFINNIDSEYIDEGEVDSYNNYLLKSKDIIFVMVGATLGKVGRVRKDNLPMLLNQNMWRVRLKDTSVDKDFLYYSFCYNSKSITKFSSGSARNFLRINDCKNLKIKLPDIKYQLLISKILNSIDEKIYALLNEKKTINNCFNKIFNSLFVNFDPLKNKNLFSKKMNNFYSEKIVDIELGKIPKNWKKEKLKNIFISKKIKVENENGIEPYVCGFTGVYPRKELYKKKLVENLIGSKVIDKGDFVFGLSTDKMKFGYMKDDKGCVSSAYNVFSVKGGFEMSSFINYFMRSKPNYYYQAVKTSSRKEHPISEDALMNLNIILPPKGLFSEFSYLEKITLKKNISIDNQIVLLSKIKEIILPCLVSGNENSLLNKAISNFS